MCCGGDRNEGGSRGGNGERDADPFSLVPSDSMCGNGSALHQERLGWSSGSISLPTGRWHAGISSLEGQAVPQGCVWGHVDNAFNLL